MASKSSVADAQEMLAPKAGAAMDGAQLLAIALVLSEDMLRNAMQKHPLGLVAGSLLLGAAVGLMPLVKPRAEDR